MRKNYVYHYTPSTYPVVSMQEVNALYDLRKNSDPDIRNVKSVPEGPKRKGAPKKPKRMKNSVGDYY